MNRPSIIALSILCLLAPRLAEAQPATTPGPVTLPHPTLEHVSIDWAISGDDDEDGVVAVRFREVGAATWREGLPLVRVPAGTLEGFSWDNRHSGSLFGLVPDTDYEIELTLTDPDGGSETRMASARTRPVPTVSDAAPRIDATPSTLDGILASASAGDVIVLGAGTYSDIMVGNDGAPGMPIVIQGSAVAEVIVDGQVRMDGRSHVWIEGLTVRGQIKFNGASNVVVRGCVVEAMTGTGDGIVSYGAGSTDGYFADNVVTGRTVWAEASLGVSGDNIGEGIAMTGPGNVIEHNRVVGFRDCISLLEDGGAVDQYSVDIIGNDLDTCADDAIEADFAMGNVRVIRNRMVNSFIALSSQPGLGGPTWFIRNVSFNNIFQVFKPNRGSVGDQWLHNTVVKPGDAMGVYTSTGWSRATFRNNLLIGGLGGGSYNGFGNGDGSVLELRSADEATCSFDYDGLGSVGTGMFSGRVGGTSFGSFAELTSSAHENNATEVDLAVFAATFEFPEVPFPERAAPELTLAAGGAAVDRGIALANVNDGFAGAAPDLGAYELGSVPPPYGPRTGVAAVCGNGAIEAGEECDDSNMMSGDGCSSACRLEAGDGGLPLADAGGVLPDGAIGVDAGPGAGGGDGCGCRVSAPTGPTPWAVLGFALLALLRRRGHSVSG